MLAHSPLVQPLRGFAFLLFVGFCLLILTSSFGCRADQKQPAVTQETDKPPAPSAKGENPVKITVTSSAFKEGSPIPKKHTGEGDDLSPALEWSGVPEGAKQLALICDDPDAPRKDPWVHWVIYSIPPDIKGLPEGVEAVAKPKQPAGSAQGKNSWPDGENMGYRGPMPPPGKPHRYFFKLYALDQAVDAKPGLTKEELLSKISGHVLAEGQLMGTYQVK
jgi:Raf kinase inhibitor-like YbhB/YbcL family protein